MRAVAFRFVRGLRFDVAETEDGQARRVQRRLGVGSGSVKSDQEAKRRVHWRVCLNKLGGIEPLAIPEDAKNCCASSEREIDDSRRCLGMGLSERRAGRRR